MKDLLLSCKYGVWFQPLVDEIDPTSFFQDHHIPIDKTLIISSDPNSSPGDEADRINRLCERESTFLLIPGQRFDLHGTRHGRGGGWYDRFLSRLHSTYYRIGVGHHSQLSSQDLVRQPWDEPMDWLLIASPGGWQTHETNGREVRRP